MYIIKNAFRCIGRSKGRNILIGIIALVIAVAACIGLSIRQASESAKETALQGLTITATITYDRSSMMQQMGNQGPGQGFPGGGGGGGNSFDRNEFANMMGNASSLTLEEYLKYADAESVQDFYYNLTAYFNGDDNLLPVTTEESEENTEIKEEGNGFSGGFPGMGGASIRFNSGDFTIIGFSSDLAILNYTNNALSIKDGGAMFEEGTGEYTCVISEELASYNNHLSVGDKITIVNPSLESETYTLTITGIYTSSETNDYSMSMFGASQDPANRIYMSANALQRILDASEAANTTITNEATGRETDSAITGTLSATYQFANPDDYYAFDEQARALGLSEEYTISSTDVSAYEKSLEPLETLSKMAGWFLVVILIIGGVILVVLNIFNVRERKYEVGVLTAMGMKKWKVATQFVCEILIVTMVAVMLGAGVGAVSSVPVTNALLEGQVESQNNQQEQLKDDFGREGNFGGSFGGNFGGMPGNMPGNMPSGMPDGNKDRGDFGAIFEGAANYITQVDSAMNLTVVFQMIGIGLLLTLVASGASVLFVMRYDPLKILANRD